MKEGQGNSLSQWEKKTALYPTTMASTHIFFLPRPFLGSKKFRVFIMAKTEAEQRRRQGELRERLLQRMPTAGARRTGNRKL